MIERPTIGNKPDGSGRGNREMGLTGMERKESTAGTIGGSAKHTIRRGFFAAALLSAGVTGASLALTTNLQAAEAAATTDVAALTPNVAIMAHIPQPLARPVRPGEGPLIGLGYIAQQYAQFQNAVSEAVTSSLGTPREVRRMLDKLRFSEPSSVARGWLAHRGLIAASDPTFAAGVQQAVAAHGQTAVLEQLSGKGQFARDLPGADSAVSAVMTAIAADNRLLTQLHERFLNAAHAFQGNRWGMMTPAPFATPEEATRDFAALEADLNEDTGLSSVLSELSPISPAQALAPHVMERVLAYGARHVISTTLQTTIPTEDLAQPDRRTTSCLNWAKLNLNQCIAAAHFPSEEAWCTGKHAIEDVRACWVNVLPVAQR